MAYNPVINIPAMAESMRPLVEQWMSGLVQIIDPNLADGEYDPFANDTEGGDPSVIWSGSARIQPLRPSCPSAR